MLGGLAVRVKSVGTTVTGMCSIPGVRLPEVACISTVPAVVVALREMAARPFSTATVGLSCSVPDMCPEVTAKVTFPT